MAKQSRFLIGHPVIPAFQSVVIGCQVRHYLVQRRKVLQTLPVFANGPKPRIETGSLYAVRPDAIASGG